jgi:trehalose 2-sulfotransferase
MAMTNVQRRPVGKPAQPVALAKPILHLNDARLDFRRSVPLRKSYVVASSYRCGSTFLCTELWRTGLLGAPWEYFNSRKGPKTLSIQDATMKRLKATSVQDYIAKLIACRTSKNGVFGLKAHFHDFEAALKKYPEMLGTLAPVSYIFIDRRDKLAQAVSMARAMQTKSWISLAKPDLSKLRYDRDLISQCLGKSEMQRLGWQRWFEARDIKPIVVYYEDMMENPSAVVRSIVEHLDVQDDEPNIIRLPPVKKQGDDTNKEWVARFEREVQSGVVANDEASAADRPPGADSGEARPNRIASPAPARTGAHFFDRYGAFAAGEQPRRLRLRHRYEAMIGRNRPLLKGASVLHLGSGDGVWCMAALDAGATRVVGIEPKRQIAEAAKAKFAKLGANAKSYQFVAAQVFAALQEFKPGQFGVVMSTGFFEQADPRYFFDQLRRLRPKHVILDTAVMPGTNPVIRFALKDGAEPASQQAPLSASILATPSYELIAFLCDVYGFRWEAVDFKAMGVADWEGIRDYESGRRRTYLLEFAA